MRRNMRFMRWNLYNRRFRVGVIAPHAACRHPSLLLLKLEDVWTPAFDTARVHEYSQSASRRGIEHQEGREERRKGVACFCFVEDDFAARRIELSEGRQEEVWTQDQGKLFIRSNTPIITPTKVAHLVHPANSNPTPNHTYLVLLV